MKPVKFYFGGDPVFDGFADGSTWNGFDNIWVTAEVHKQIIEHFNAECLTLGYFGDQLTEEMLQFTEIEPDAQGLYSYANGFATSIDDMDVDAAIDVLTETVNDLADWGSVFNATFEDKELQATRLAAHARALQAIEVIRAATVTGNPAPAKCDDCWMPASYDDIGTACRECGRGMIAAT